VESSTKSGDINNSIAARYGFAMLATVAGLLVREMLAPFFGAANPYHAAWVAVAFSAWYCGVGPAILTTFVSMLGVWYWFLPPYHSFALEEPRTQIPGMIGFLVFSGFIIVLGEINRRSKARVQQEIAGRLSTKRELTQKEEERFVANERLRALMTALPVGVSFSDDRTCQTIRGNPAAIAQFEVDPEDNLSASAPDLSAAGRQMRFFQNGRAMSNVELPLQRAVSENREIAPMEFEVQLPSGRRWIAESSAAPIHGGSSSPAIRICRNRSIGLFKRDGVFQARFEVDQPDAVRFGRLDGPAGALDPGDALPVRRPDFELARDGRAQCPGNGLASLPRRIHFHAAAGAESMEAAFRPCGGQRR